MIPYPNDFNYAGSRLPKTVVMHQGKVVEVQNVLIRRGEVEEAYAYMRKAPPVKPVKNPVWITDISSGENAVVSLQELDVDPVRLGYVNHEGVASYVVRVPMRNDWRQGMRYANIRSLQGFPANQIPMSAFVPTILNDYPLFEDTLKALKAKGLLSLAWHRDWCTDNIGTLYYRSNEVGRVMEGRPVLADGHQNLQEALDEACHRRI